MLFNAIITIAKIYVHSNMLIYYILYIYMCVCMCVCLLFTNFNMCVLLNK